MIIRTVGAAGKRKPELKKIDSELHSTERRRKCRCSRSGFREKRETAAAGCVTLSPFTSGGPVTFTPFLPRMKKKQRNYTCQECNYAVAKPALLIQHLRSHSEEAHIMIMRPDKRFYTGSHPNSEVKVRDWATRLVLGWVTTQEVLKPFPCPVSGCSRAYKRQDHLTRHMKIHEGTRFSCSIPGCDESFTVKSNLERHLKRHEEDPDFPKPKSSGEKKFKCLQPGCEKMFRYPSTLRSHEDTVHGVVYAEVSCVFPGCGEKFAGEAALMEHAVEAHPYLSCEVCGETIARRLFARHVRIHGAGQPVKVACPYEGCEHHYTRESNLRTHIKSVHLNLKPYVCSYDGCGKSFAHKSARKRHELSAAHVHTGIDFEEELMKPSVGGRKPVQLEKVEDLYIIKPKPRKGASVGAKKLDPQDCRRVEGMEIG